MLSSKHGREQLTARHRDTMALRPQAGKQERLGTASQLLRWDQVAKLPPSRHHEAGPAVSSPEQYCDLHGALERTGIIMTAGEASSSRCPRVDLGSFQEKGVPERAEKVQ